MGFRAECPSRSPTGIDSYRGPMCACSGSARHLALAIRESCAVARVRRGPETRRGKRAWRPSATRHRSGGVFFPLSLQLLTGDASSASLRRRRRARTITILAPAVASRAARRHQRLRGFHVIETLEVADAPCLGGSAPQSMWLLLSPGPDGAGASRSESDGRSSSWMVAPSFCTRRFSRCFERLLERAPVARSVALRIANVEGTNGARRQGSDPRVARRRSRPPGSPMPRARHWYLTVRNRGYSALASSLRIIRG